MAGDHGGFLVQAVQTLLDRPLDGVVVAAPEVGSADAAAEQGVTGDQELGLGEPETHGAGRVPRGVQGHPATTGKLLVVGQPLVGSRHRLVGHAEHAALHFQVVPEELVFLVQVQRRTGGLLQLAGSEEVIQVGMGVDDADQLQPMGLQPRQDQLMVAARIDDDGLPADRIADQGAVALPRAKEASLFLVDDRLEAATSDCVKHHYGC